MKPVMHRTPSTPEPINEAELVAAVQHGDASAFTPLVDRHLDAIHAFVSVKLPVAHLADEITHDAFVFAYRNIERFTPGTSLRAWLRAIAANKVRAELERITREHRNQLAYAQQREIELAAEEADELAVREIQALEDCIRAVPPHLQELLELKYHGERSGEEIARQMGRSVAWVHTNLCRVRAQLRTCVEGKLAGASA